MAQTDSDSDDNFRVVDISPSSDQIHKPQELIQITGHDELTLVARRCITLLWHNAHNQGVGSGRDYTIELDQLVATKHKGYKILEDAVESLMKTILTIRKTDGTTTRVQFLGGNDMGSPGRAAGVLTYSFDKRLEDILKESSIWGQISLPVLVALSNKYSITLYERVAQWAGLNFKNLQEFELEEFREAMGIPEGKYEKFGAFNKHVLKPSVREINALAPFNIAVMPVKRGKQVTKLKLSWWKKSTEERNEAFLELQRPRVGRKARIHQKAETVFAVNVSEERQGSQYSLGD